jgi:hypothetical protein
LDRRLAVPEDEGVADLAEDAGRRAIVNVDIRTAQIAERFACSSTVRFKNTPGARWLLESLPSDGQAKLERRVETRRRGAFPIQLDTREVVERIAATAN